MSGLDHESAVQDESPTGHQGLIDAAQAAEAAARSALQHREHLRADLARAEAWVADALKREMAARFALRAARMTAPHDAQASPSRETGAA